MRAENLHQLTALDLVRHYRAGELSPVEVADAVLARLEEVDGNLNAFCHRDDEAFRAAAVASEERWVAGAPLGALDGVPTSVKDVLRIRGWPTRMGSKAVDAKQSWTADAPAVARLRESGALFIGMTTTPEMGWKGVTDSPLYGQTRNPWNLRMTPGGSSGGAAAAVACGVGPLALGTDGGGSVRIPASFCGIVGFKPTFGRVAAWPPGLYGTLSHVGPMARTVSDAALLLDVIGKPDPRDPWSLADDGIEHLTETRCAVNGLKVAYSRDLGHIRVAHAVGEVVDQAVRRLGDLGMEIEEIDFDVPKAEEAFRTLWYAAAAAAIRTQSRHRRRFLDYGLTKVAAEGEDFRAVDIVEAERARMRYSADVGALLERFDLLVTPTLPICAFEVGLEVPSGWPHERWYTWTPFTWPFNLTGQPALSVPCGFTADGLPVGLQIVARRQADALVLRAGAAYQERFPTLSSWPTAGRAAS